jgi:alpha/beta superfamily hydrolase
MYRLPAPALSLTIPSVHSSRTSVECRVYHPLVFLAERDDQGKKWSKKAAVVAHPYAPLGGCFDDPVVASVACSLLEAGFVVGTFNFR